MKEETILNSGVVKSALNYGLKYAKRRTKS